MNKFIKPMFFTILLIFGISTSASAELVTKYVDMGVPTNVNTSFKTWMDWRCVTDETSAQYKLIRRWGWCNENGFMRANGEKDLGIEEDYYMIALGSYYGTEIGTKYRITTDTGQIFYGILSDQKADIHTNSTNQYAQNNDVVEFLVDTRYLRIDVKKMGSAGIFDPLRGHVEKIERIDFIDTPKQETKIKPLPRVEVNRGGIMPNFHRKLYINNKNELLKWIKPIPNSIIKGDIL